MRVLSELLATSDELMSFIAEPAAMLLWGIALLTLCSVIQARYRREPAPASSSPDLNSSETPLPNVDGIPSFTART